VMTREKFTELTGIPQGVLNAQIDKGYWPTIKIGKRSLINLDAVRLNMLLKTSHVALLQQGELEQ
jgi:hypothetical protein